MSARSRPPRLVTAFVLVLLCSSYMHTGAAAVADPPGGDTNSSSGDKPRRVIIIIGNTGSRAAYSVLEAAGVWMHPGVDADLNARAYERVLANITGSAGVLLQEPPPNWVDSNQPRRFYSRVTPPDLEPALQQLHHEMAADMLRAVPPHVTVWAWKHPHAMYTLPFVVAAFPNAHIIHQVQDARDYALRNLRPRSRQTKSTMERFFVQLLTGKNFTDAELQTPSYSEAVAQTWALAYVRSAKWAGLTALGMKGQHSTVRLEDLCEPAGRHRGVETMLRNADLQHDGATVAQAAAAVRAGRCRHGGWKTTWHSPDAQLRAAVRRIDADTAAALEAFGYEPRSQLELPAWLNATDTMASLARAGKAATAGSSGRPLILTFVGNGYQGVVRNWLAWLRDAGVNTSHVLVVARDDSFDSLRPLVAGFGGSTFKLPSLSPSSSPDVDEKGRRVAGWKNLRAGVWLERVRSVYELVLAGVPVLLTDLDAIWQRNPLPALLGAAAGQPRGFDLVLSRGFFPSEVQATLGVAGCMGFMLINATQPAAVFVRTMLREKLRHLAMSEVRYYNDQRVLNLQLVDADLAYNVSLAQPDADLWNRTSIWGAEVTTAPQPLRALYVPQTMVQRLCADNVTDPGALVVHCGSPKSGGEKEAFLRDVLKLWKD